MPMTAQNWIGRLMAALVALLCAALLTAGCHDDTPPSDTAVPAPPAALPINPARAPTPVLVKAVQKAKKTAVPKSYLQTDSAGIVIVNGQKPESSSPQTIGAGSNAGR